MAASGRKKLVQQDELRKLMKAKQRETAARKRIQSPLAKYPSFRPTAVGRLLQTTKRKGPVLGSPESKRIKGHSECTQPGSVQGKMEEDIGPIEESHWEEILQMMPSLSLNSEDQSSASSAASTLPSGFFEAGNKLSQTPDPGSASSVKLPAGNYDEPEEEEDGNVVPAVPGSTQHPMEIPLSQPTAQDSRFPPDLFDSKTHVVSHSGSVLKAEVQEKIVEKKENTAEALPEGFFDDPEVDAKVRKVDAPKDHLDKEWEEFQKEMRQVSTVSEAIVAKEEEEGRLDRQIDEIDEQIECYRRIEHLRNRKDFLHNTLMDTIERNSSKHEEDDIGGDDEEILSTMLTHSWREKGVFH
ncbi:zinc finger protein 830 isoform X2 [Eleutherodactylus coqui]|uniref:zinc finger protein 830 isoform X2 n=1 Tax=Eleutherodactylus coqui TaxID=57060 RepID=UPI003462006B